MVIQSYQLHSHKSYMSLYIQLEYINSPLAVPCKTYPPPLEDYIKLTQRECRFSMEFLILGNSIRTTCERGVDVFSTGGV